jgi:hypothetical protein
MYPPFTKTRPRLPSLSTVFQPIEQYHAALEERCPLAAPAVASLEALDAYLVHLFLNCHPSAPTVLDLAAEATAGASTLLGLLHPRVKHVRAVGGPLPGDRRAYRGVVEDFLRDQGQPLARLEWIPNADATSQRNVGADAVLFLDAGREAVDAEVERWLNVFPAAIVLVFGLGAVGDCAAIDSLLRRFPSGSRRRFALVRDYGEALSASRLGVVASRDESSADVALFRLRQLFAGNYTFLGLLRSATEQAIRSTSSDQDVLQSGHCLFGDWNAEINRLKQAAQQAREEKAVREEELLRFQRTLSYRLADRLCRWRGRLAPETTWRYRVYHLVRRSAQVWHKEGASGLLRRMARRCLRR